MMDKHPELRRLAEALLNAVIADQERQAAENKENPAERHDSEKEADKV